MSSVHAAISCPVAHESLSYAVGRVPEKLPAHAHRHIVQQTLLFERLGIDDVKSGIIAACNGTEYFLASLIAIFIIDRIGRRKLMLFGAVGQCLTMVLLAILGSIDTSATQIVSAVLLFVFNSFFAVGWLGMTWLYVRPTPALHNPLLELTIT